MTDKHTPLVERAEEWATVVREADKQWSEPLATLLGDMATRITALEAERAELVGALAWAMPALEDLVENNEIDEHEVCDGQSLCCNACHQSGCLSAKLQRARATLAKVCHEGEGND